MPCMGQTQTLRDRCIIYREVQHLKTGKGHGSTRFAAAIPLRRLLLDGSKSYCGTVASLTG